MLCYNKGSGACFGKTYPLNQVTPGAGASISILNAANVGNIQVYKGYSGPVIASVLDSLGNVVDGACASLTLSCADSSWSASSATQLSDFSCRFSVTGNTAGTTGGATFKYAPSSGSAVTQTYGIVVLATAPSAATNAFIAGDIYAGALAVAGEQAQVTAVLLSGGTAGTGAGGGALVGSLSGQTVALSFTLGGNTLAALATTATANGDGSFTASYTPTAAGALVVSLVVNGASLSTTYAVTVVPGELAPALTTASLSSYSAVCPSDVTLILALVDSYGNALSSGPNGPAGSDWVPLVVVVSPASSAGRTGYTTALSFSTAYGAFTASAAAPVGYLAGSYKLQVFQNIGTTAVPAWDATTTGILPTGSYSGGALGFTYSGGAIVGDAAHFSAWGIAVRPVVWRAFITQSACIFSAALTPASPPPHAPSLQPDGGVPQFTAGVPITVFTAALDACGGPLSNSALANATTLGQIAVIYTTGGVRSGWLDCSSEPTILQSARPTHNVFARWRFHLPR